MTGECDHKSVGIIVWRGKRILLMERNVWPWGYAPPAGHVDNHGGFEEAAKGELREEVGLRAVELELLIEGKKETKCSRPGGIWHYWKIYKARTEGEVKASEEEVKQVGWYDKDGINSLCEKTKKYLKGEISEKDWELSPGLESVWYEWFQELKII